MQYKQNKGLGPVVDAVQFDPKAKWPKCVTKHRNRGYVVTQPPRHMVIPLKAGQYIITHPSGEITVMGAAAFEKVFVKIDSVVDPKPELTSDEVIEEAKNQAHQELGRQAASDTEPAPTADATTLFDKVETVSDQRLRQHEHHCEFPDQDCTC